MLSIAKLSTGRAEYYLEQVHAGADEYYTADQAEPGYVTGKAAARLGLGGQVSPEAFRRVLDALHPDSGEPLGVPATSAKRVAGFDLCFSAPKSVSVAWALAPPELANAIAGAHDNAVGQAVSAMEAEAVRARRGAGGREVVETEGIVGAAFPHRSSRAGDPQLHTHVVAANITPDATGRWSAPYGHRVYAWVKTVGYLYHAELRASLAELGFAFGPCVRGRRRSKASQRPCSRCSPRAGPRSRRCSTSEGCHHQRQLTRPLWPPALRKRRCPGSRSCARAGTNGPPSWASAPRW